jgi:hypothetical protein
MPPIAFCFDGVVWVWWVNAGGLFLRAIRTNAIRPHRGDLFLRAIRTNAIRPYRGDLFLRAIRTNAIRPYRGLGDKLDL